MEIVLIFLLGCLVQSILTRIYLIYFIRMCDEESTIDLIRLLYEIYKNK